MGSENPEKAAIRNQGRNFSPTEISVLTKQLNQFSTGAPQLDDFVDVFSVDEIARDKAECERLLAKFDKEMTPQEKEEKFYATVLEMIIMQLSNAWLPGQLSKTSSYDDLHNKTDLYLEIPTDDGSTLKISIDVTAGATRATEKIGKILSEDIPHNRFARLKYFQSDYDPEKKGRTEMPSVVVGADREEIVELARLFLDLTKLKGGLKERKHEDLIKHVFGKELFFDVLMQLEIALDILSDPSKLESVNRIVRQFKDYQKQKTLQIKDLESKNKVHLAIQSCLPIAA